MTADERKNKIAKYQSQVPAPLNSKFTNKCTRAVAIQNYRKRKQLETELFAAGKIVVLTFYNLDTNGHVYLIHKMLVS